MTEPSSAVEEVPAVGPTEVFEGDSIEDLNDTETTLDDVLMPCRTKKSKLLDEELPDVDDNEEFPLQIEEMNENWALSLENGENDLRMDEEALLLATNSHNTREPDLNLAAQKDAEELALSKEEEEEKKDEENSEEKSNFSTSINNEVDVVDVEDEEGAEGYEEQFSEEDDGKEEEETMRAIARAQNQKEARDLLLQLDDSTRSKLCLTAMEKYGEELFYGHEVARDAILVDACAQDSILSLMRDAIRVKDLYLRGSSAAAPLELDDDEDEEEEGEGEDEIGGYEDEEEDADDEEEQSTGSIEDNDDEVVVISEEEEGEKADVEASSSILCSSEKVRLMPQPHSAAETGCDTDPNDGYKGDHSEQGTWKMKH
ncbi:unnamed protein product [Peronospora destructor]|uniref:Uncharacterized protein n=1 Tax=Peronospora destructor TaxID=86335 RepID=A0AAV0VAQ0_9STRA|nr:unnamed protein product [Peronospora destructor]